MIIGITGAICVGKTEFARYLIQTYGFEAINVLEIFKLRFRKEYNEARKLKRFRKKQSSLFKDEKQGGTEEESKDEEDDDGEPNEDELGLSGDKSFCHAYYMVEFKEIREKIIKEVFRDLTSKWDRHFVIYPLSPCDNIKLML